MINSKFINERLSSAYLTEEKEIAATARTLFFVTLFFAVLALLMALIIQGAGLERPLMIALSFLFTGFSILVLYGKARGVSLSLSYILSIMLTLMIFTNPGHFGYLEYYMIGFLNLFAMIVTLLVGFYAWQTIPIVVIIIISLILDCYLRILPHAQDMVNPAQIDDIIVVSVLSLLSSASIYGSFRKTNRFNKIAKESGAQSDRQLAILRGAMEASGEALSHGENLTESASLTTKLTAQALNLTKTAEKSMREVLVDSQKLEKELDGIGANSQTARTSAEAQSSVINQTSAAVEEMTASILNITNVTRERRAAVQDLTKSTKEGQNLIAVSSISMKKVEDSTGAILEIVKVISSVAAQTNLLAMNAAIEAAHAGTYGQGFAVVADEIRKLSEQTSKSVKAVTDTVKETIKDIRTASEGNNRTVSSFTSIAQEATLVAGAMDEIIQGLDELSRGTEEINRGVSDSVTSTNELRTAVGALDSLIETARSSLLALNKGASKVEEELTQVQNNVESISGEAQKVEQIGAFNSKGLSSIKKALDHAGL